MSGIFCNAESLRCRIAAIIKTIYLSIHIYIYVYIYICCSSRDSRSMLYRCYMFLLLDLPECWHKVSCSVFGSALHKSLAPSLHHSPADTQLKYTRMCSTIHSCHGVTNYFLRQTLFKTAAHCSQRISEAISQTLTHSVILIHRPNLFPSMHSSTKRSPQQLQYRLYVCVYI